jgi:hypothetical protein
VSDDAGTPFAVTVIPVDATLANKPAEGSMKRLMVRYRVKPDRASENESYIARVFEQLERDQPPGLRYASFKLDDGVSFVHIVSLEDPDGNNPLGELPAFKAFTAGIKDRCEEPPVAVHLTKVGSYPSETSSG